MVMVDIIQGTRYSPNKIQRSLYLITILIVISITNANPSQNHFAAAMCGCVPAPLSVANDQNHMPNCV